MRVGRVLRRVSIYTRRGDSGAGETQESVSGLPGNENKHAVRALLTRRVLESKAVSIGHVWAQGEGVLL